MQTALVHQHAANYAPMNPIIHETLFKVNKY